MLIHNAITNNGQRFKYVWWCEYAPKRPGVAYGIVKEIVYYQTRGTEIDHIKKRSLAALKRLLDASL